MNTKRSRRLNWTGRITIDKKCIDVEREEVAENEPEAVVINLDLSEYSFPKSATVMIEASHRLTSMRFEFGTIGEMILRRRLELSEFQSQNLPTFRLLVVDVEHSPGRLLGSAERIKIADTETTESNKNIFKVDCRDIGEEAWRVEFHLDDLPKLVINRKIPNYLYRLETDKSVQSQILPIAFRIVLSELARNIRDTIEGEEGWVSTWLQFCNELCGAEDPRQIAGDDDRLNDWIDNCVTEFANFHSFASHLAKEWEN